jgi:Matrixin
MRLVHCFPISLALLTTACAQDPSDSPTRPLGNPDQAGKGDEVSLTTLLDVSTDLDATSAGKFAKVLEQAAEAEAKLDIEDAESMLELRGKVQKKLSKYVLSSELVKPSEKEQESWQALEDMWAANAGINAQEKEQYIDDGGEEGSEGETDGAPPPYSLYSSWPDHHLAWCFEDETSQLSYADQVMALAGAFGTWDGASPVNFEYTGCGTGVEIRAGFHTGYHWDSHWTLDHSGFNNASGGVMAHAFYPTLGYLHFDDDETWVRNASARFADADLDTLALHEIGHVLGLEHASLGVAVMFGTYSVANRRLDPDDVAGIQDLYDGPEDLCLDAFVDAGQATTALMRAASLALEDAADGISTANTVAWYALTAYNDMEEAHTWAMQAAWGYGGTTEATYAAIRAEEAQGYVEEAARLAVDYRGTGNANAIFQELVTARMHSGAAAQSSRLCAGAR